MSASNLRVHRTYRWVSDPITESTRFGAPIGMHLLAIDTLEYWDPVAGSDGASSTVTPSLCAYRPDRIANDPLSGYGMWATPIPLAYAGDSLPGSIRLGSSLLQTSSSFRS